MGENPMVCISPGQATTFSFDTDFLRESMTLEGAERFSKVDAGQSTLKVVPSEKLVSGERLKLTVRFKDDDAPSGAALMLVVHAIHAATYVEVYREKRTVESYQRELEEKAEDLQQCRSDNARLRGERRGPGGIVGPRAAGVMNSDGIRGHAIARDLKTMTTGVRVTNVTAYRSAVRVAVELTLTVPEDTPPWKLEGAALTRQGRVSAQLKVDTFWPLEPIVPGMGGTSVFVEAEAPADATGPFTLRLWDSTGTRPVTVTGITFP
jgi:uncharacterized protein (TIGR02268 family)